MSKRSVLSVLVLVLFGCSRSDPVKVEHFDGTEVVSKHNFRSAEKEGHKVEFWTSGMNGGIPQVGYRVYMPKREKDTSPATKLRVHVKKTDEPTGEWEVLLEPILKKTLIEGGYIENIRIDKTQFLDRPGKFVGQEGVWEVLPEPLFGPTVLRPEPSNFPTGRFRINAYVAIDGGPNFAFENIPYRIFRDRLEAMESPD
jgi:hypothetical protein